MLSQELVPLLSLQRAAGLACLSTSLTKFRPEDKESSLLLGLTPALHRTVNPISVSLLLFTLIHTGCRRTLPGAHLPAKQTAP